MKRKLCGLLAVVMILTSITVPVSVSADENFAYATGDTILYYNAGSSATPGDITSSSGNFRDDSVLTGGDGFSGRGIAGKGGGAQYITVPVSTAIGSAVAYNIQFKICTFGNAGTNFDHIYVPVGSAYVVAEPDDMATAGVTVAAGNWYDCVFEINGTNYTWKAKNEGSTEWKTVATGEATLTGKSNIVTGGQNVAMEAIYVYQKAEDDENDEIELPSEGYIEGDNLLYYNAGSSATPGDITSSSGNFRDDSVLTGGDGFSGRGIAGKGGGAQYITVPVSTAIGSAVAYNIQFKICTFGNAGTNFDHIYVPVGSAYVVAEPDDMATAGVTVAAGNWYDCVFEINGTNYTWKAKNEGSTEWKTVATGEATLTGKSNIVTGGANVAMEAIYVYQAVENEAVRAINIAAGSGNWETLKQAFEDNATALGLDLAGKEQAFYESLLGKTYLNEEEVGAEFSGPVVIPSIEEYDMGDHLIYYNAGDKNNPNGITSTGTFRNDSVVGGTGRGIAAAGGSSNALTVPVASSISGHEAYNIQFKVCTFGNVGTDNANIYVPLVGGAYVTAEPDDMHNAGVAITVGGWYDWLF